MPNKKKELKTTILESELLSLKGGILKRNIIKSNKENAIEIPFIEISLTDSAKLVTIQHTLTIKQALELANDIIDLNNEINNIEINKNEKSN